METARENNRALAREKTFYFNFLLEIIGKKFKEFFFSHIKTFTRRPLSLSLSFSLASLSFVKAKGRKVKEERNKAPFFKNKGGKKVSLSKNTNGRTFQLFSLSLSLCLSRTLKIFPPPSSLPLSVPPLRISPSLGGKRQVAEHVLLGADRGKREELLHGLRSRPLGSVAVAVFFFSIFFICFRRWWWLWGRESERFLPFFYRCVPSFSWHCLWMLKRRPKAQSGGEKDKREREENEPKKTRGKKQKKS